MARVDDLWLSCGQALDTVLDMRVSEIVFWHERAVAYRKRQAASARN